MCDGAGPFGGVFGAPPTATFSPLVARCALSESHEDQRGGDVCEQVVADLFEEDGRRVVRLKNRNQRQTVVVREIVKPRSAREAGGEISWHRDSQVAGTRAANGDARHVAGYLVPYERVRTAALQEVAVRAHGYESGVGGAGSRRAGGVLNGHCFEFSFLKSGHVNQSLLHAGQIVVVHHHHQVVDLASAGDGCDGHGQRVHRVQVLHLLIRQQRVGIVRGGHEAQAARIVVQFRRGDLREGVAVRVDPRVEQAHASRGRAHNQGISRDGGGGGTSSGGGGDCCGYGVDGWRHFRFSLIVFTRKTWRRGWRHAAGARAILLVLFRGVRSGRVSVLLVEILLAHLRAAWQVGPGGHCVENGLREFRPRAGGVRRAGPHTAHTHCESVWLLLASRILIDAVA